MSQRVNANDALGKRPLGYVAFWQFLTFLMLVCVIWVNEVLDLPKLIYGESSSGVNYTTACILTAGVILVGFITVAHTIVLQRRMLRGFMTICSYCGKVHLNANAWEQIDEFVTERTALELSHGVCPACYAKVVQENRLDSDATSGVR